MKKNLYFHSFDMYYFNTLDEFPGLKRISEYSITEYAELKSRNEVGKLTSDECDIHFLLGNIAQKNCPWCASHCELKEKNFNEYVEVFLECVRTPSPKGEGF